jgi:hypothetical protein
MTWQQCNGGKEDGKGGNKVNATIKLRQWWQRLRIVFDSDGGGRQQ